MNINQYLVDDVIITLDKVEKGVWFQVSFVSQSISYIHWNVNGNQ